MKTIATLFFCIFIAGNCCGASADDEFEGWRERASKTKAGMSLVEAEGLFPVYPSLPIDHDQALVYFPSIFHWGAHQTLLRWVAADIAVWIDYETSPPGHPLTGPATVERRNPAYILGIPPTTFSHAPFTLSNTISKDAGLLSMMSEGVTMSEGIKPYY